MEGRDSVPQLWLSGVAALEFGLDSRDSTPWCWVSGVATLGGYGVEMQGFDGVSTEGAEPRLEDGVLTIGSDMEHH